MGMGRDHQVQCVHPKSIELLGDPGALVPGVDEHRLVSGADQQAVALAHVQHVQGQGAGGRNGGPAPRGGSESREESVSCEHVP